LLAASTSIDALVMNALWSLNWTSGVPLNGANGPRTVRS
jgi:hypothetical protein